MLAKLNEVLTWAQKKQCAIGAFNTPNLESILAVIDRAEHYQVPVIISHAEVHEEITPLETIGPAMLLYARKASVPVVVHLDHGGDLNYLEQALKMGFSSIMFDGSQLSYDENRSLTRKAVRLARSYGAEVEAELGAVGGRETQEVSAQAAAGSYTDPKLADAFVKETDIAALAVAFGTAHGFYRQEPTLDLDLLAQIARNVSVPLVMHGGSGIDSAGYRQVIERGIRKINYYSYLSKAALDQVRASLPGLSYYHDLVNAAMAGMRSDLDRVFPVFYRLQI